MHKLITLANLEKYNVNIQKVIDNKVPTKVSAFENDSNYISLDEAQKMIDDTTKNLYEFCTNDDILSLFDTSIPEEPETPVEPEDPEIPVDPNSDIGFVNWNGMMYIKDKDLSNGEYIFRYIDSDDNIIDNFNPIMTFDVDHSDEITDIPSSGVVPEN